MKKMSLVSRVRENFDLDGVSPAYFWKSEWEAFDPTDRLTTVSWGYLIYRFAFAAYFLITLIEDLICSSDDLSLFFIFLTNLTYTVQTAYSLLFFTLVVLARVRQRKVLHQPAPDQDHDPANFSQRPRLPPLEKIVWILSSIVNAIPIGVTAIYWIFLFEGNGDSTTCAIVTNLFVHAFNSVLALIDNLVMAVPCRVSHAIFPVLYAFAYLLFSILYEVGGGAYEGDNEYIYSLIDWRNKAGMAAGTAVGFTILAGVLHFVFSWGVYRLRLLLVHKITKKNLNQEEQRPGGLVG